MSDDVADIVRTLAQVFEYWLADPQRVAELQAGLGAAYLDLWASAARRLAGEPSAPVVSADPKDKRFADPEWSQNQFFDFLKQAYLLTSHWAEHLVQNAEGLDPHTRAKAEFYVKQIANAISPSNFVLTNPELLRETMASNAENLVRGMHMLGEDIKAGHGNLRIRQSDGSTFEVGRNLALTPGKVVFQNELMQLIQYGATTEEVLKVPLLIVPPWINKFYILDLVAGEILHQVVRRQWHHGVRDLLGQSRTPSSPKKVSSSTCARASLPRSTRSRRSPARRRCTPSAIASAARFWRSRSPGSPPSAKPARCPPPSSRRKWTSPLAAIFWCSSTKSASSQLEKHMKEQGYLEASRMATAFNLLRSNDLIWPYVVNNYLRGKTPHPFDILFWNSDATRMPAANHAFYLRNCYLSNRLSRGEMEIAGTKLDLRKIKVPVYNLATREDHIAPAKSVLFGSQYFGGPVTFVLAGSGHIAGVINPPGKAKYQYWTGGEPIGSDVETWMASAEEHPGSWWPNWLDWIKARDAKTVPAREIGGGKLTPIEDAPGSYVKVKSWE